MSGPISRAATASLVLGVALAAGAGQAGPAPAGAWLDTEGRRVDPFPDGENGLAVFLFLRTDCPIANRYAPEIRRLREAYEPRGVAFWRVYPDGDESAERIRKHGADFGYASPALLDPEHALVRLAGASVTPEAALFSSGRRLLYRGRIDDRYVDFGKARPAPASRDLARALDEALQRKPVSRARTKAVGCFIPDPP